MHLSCRIGVRKNLSLKRLLEAIGDMTQCLVRDVLAFKIVPVLYFRSNSEFGLGLFKFFVLILLSRTSDDHEKQIMLMHC